MNKRQNIRNQIRAMRRRLEPVFVQKASATVQRAAFNLDEWRKTKIVCCYLAMPLEVQTETIIEECRRDKKLLFVPAFQNKLQKYIPAVFDPDEDVQLGKFNVLEPVSPRWIRSEKIDLVFVPGLAFDRQGGRLGHGAGHYDRLLTRKMFRSACKVGLAFDFQIFNRLPLRADDVRMDVVITESEIYRC